MWPVKVEYVKVKLDRNEMNMIRWICGLTPKERKKEKTEFRELLGLEPVCLVIKTSRLWWFGRVEHIDDADWFS